MNGLFAILVSISMLISGPAFATASGGGVSATTTQDTQKLLQKLKPQVDHIQFLLYLTNEQGQILDWSRKYEWTFRRGESLAVMDGIEPGMYVINTYARNSQYAALFKAVNTVRVEAGKTSNVEIILEVSDYLNIDVAFPVKGSFTEGGTYEVSSSTNDGRHTSSGMQMVYSNGGFSGTLHIYKPGEAKIVKIAVVDDNNVQQNAIYSLSVDQIAEGTVTRITLEQTTSETGALSMAVSWQGCNGLCVELAPDSPEAGYILPSTSPIAAVFQWQNTTSSELLVDSFAILTKSDQIVWSVGCMIGGGVFQEAAAIDRETQSVSFTSGFKIDPMAHLNMTCWSEIGPAPNGSVTALKVDDVMAINTAIESVDVYTENSKGHDMTVMDSIVSVSLTVDSNSNTVRSPTEKMAEFELKATGQEANPVSIEITVDGAMLPESWQITTPDGHYFSGVRLQSDSGKTRIGFSLDQLYISGGQTAKLVLSADTTQMQTGSFEFSLDTITWTVRDGTVGEIELDQSANSAKVNF